MLKWLFGGRSQPQPPSAAAAPPPGEALARALADHEAGRFEQADAAYREALAADPGNAEVLLQLGRLQRRVGRGEEALDSYRRALALSPGSVLAQLRVGETLAALGRHQEAVAALEAAAAKHPDYAALHNSLGMALRETGRLDEALAACQRAVALEPGLYLARFNVANLLREKGFLAEAAAAYRAAIGVNPAIAEFHNNLGNVLKEMGSAQEALACYRQALVLKPDFADALYNAAQLLRDSGQVDEAVGAFRSVIEARPAMVEAHYDLGNLLKNRGDKAGALECYRMALQVDPDYAEARWAHAMTQLPMVAEDDGELSRSRAEFDAELDALERWCEANGPVKAARAVGVQQPFYLAYQEEDNRELLSRYGALCSHLMGAWQEAAGLRTAAIVTRAEIRVGIVSAHIHDHSVWNAIVKGWLQRLDRNRFDVRLFHLGKANDVETAFAKTMVTHYTYGKTDPVEWAQLILGHQLDALIYPEIGMDPTTARLASLRLAPVQAASWGHPHTTGLPTMDYFLSAEGLEPPGAEAHYTEKLVRLPGLGCSLEPAKGASAAADLAALGIREGVPVLMCAGTPFKYTPRHDAVLAAIARRLGECQLVFFTPGKADTLMGKLRARMARSFAAAGLELDACAAFVPWQSRPHFQGLLSQADVFLDTMGFSGFNTAIQAIECGLPVAAYEGRFLRGRLASGILRRMGMDELVAGNDAAFVDTAVRLAQDAAWWGGVRERMAAEAPKLYGDAEPVRALEKFLEDAVRK